MFLSIFVMQKGMPTLEEGIEADLAYHMKVVHEMVGKRWEGDVIQKYIRAALDGTQHSLLPMQIKITNVAKTYQPAVSPIPLWMKDRQEADTEEEAEVDEKDRKEIKEEEDT